ncbi:MAG: sensor histidine kinase [Bacteroidota bacterium]
MKNIKHFDHAAFWLFIYLFIFDYHFWEGNWWEAVGQTLLELATYAIVVYLNLLLLIPAFLQKKREWLYVLSAVALIAGYVAVLRLSGLEYQLYEAEGWRNIFSMVLNTSLFFLLSTLYWFFQQRQIEREQKLLLQSEKLTAELNFLRTQISPHFIFNTLNNIYTLALQKHENAAPMVAKLSTLMRYVLYEGQGGQVTLVKEIETLKQYIELHLLRKPRSQNVDFYVDGAPKGWQIAPLLLINFVENCFKHSNMDQDENAYIKVSCEIKPDGQFVFSTENSVATSTSATGSGGVGLANVQRQLELNYPDRHQLATTSQPGVYHIQLKLFLSKL